MLMGELAACQRSPGAKVRLEAPERCATVQVSPRRPLARMTRDPHLARLHTRTFRMEFGLPPEFSTPVEKPVENAGLLVVGTLNGPDLRHFCEAKVRRRLFGALLREPREIQPCSGWRR